MPLNIVRILVKVLGCVNEFCFSSHGFLRYDALEALVPAASLKRSPDLPHVLASKRAVNF